MSRLFSYRNPGSGGVVVIEVPAPPTEPPEYPAGIFGTGVDGNITYSVNTTVNSNVNANNITINPGVTVTVGTSGGVPVIFRAQGTFTNNGILSANGVTSTGTGGGAGGAGGGDGGDGATVSGGSVVTPAEDGGDIPWGNGGNGGAGGGPSSPGDQGVVTLPTGTEFDSLADLAAGTIDGIAVTGGAGGGGGSPNGTNSTGGVGGGGGGGRVLVCAPIIAGSGSFLANGGSGRDKNATAGGAGGAGGGGLVILVCHTIDEDLSISVLAGDAGVGGTAPSATGGQQGRIYVAADDPTQSPNWVGRFIPIQVAP